MTPQRIQPPKKKSKKTIIVASIAALLGLGAGTYWMWGGSRSDSDQWPDRTRRVTALGPTLAGASTRPNNPDGWANATPEQRQVMIEQRRQESEKRIDDYFALPPGLQRVARIDQMINEMETRRTEFEKRMAQRPSTTMPGQAEAGTPGGRGGRPRDPARMIMRVTQSEHPERAARRAQLFADIMQRRKERGLPVMPFPPGGRPR